MHKDVYLAIVGGDLIRNLTDRESVEASVALIVLDIIGDVCGSVEDGVQGVHLLDLHLCAVRKHHVLVKLARPQ